MLAVQARASGRAIQIKRAAERSAVLQEDVGLWSLKMKLRITFWPAPAPSMLILGWRDVLGMIFDGAHDLHFRLGRGCYPIDILLQSLPAGEE